MPEVITYPFSAIVALTDMKLALVLNAINPKIGGLLIRGPKGSGKTTAVRALADLLPNIKVAKECQFNDNPEDPSNMCDKCRITYAKDVSLPFEERKMKVIDLPLGATEDRVVGSLDVEKAIKVGVEALEPGILAQANQNILYIDEVNLLPDHIADDLLDSAATGWNVVEREGISVKHPSRFIFVGTMNPEEGQLRPQLLDRFPLSVAAERVTNVNSRIEIVKRNIEFEEDPEAFVKKFGPLQEELKNKIIQARKVLSDVQVPDKLIEVVCAVCLELKVDGVRPDIVITKTAKTLAAFENEKEVTPQHMLRAAELALSHRTREGGFLEPATSQEIKETLTSKLKESNFTRNSKEYEEIKGQKEKEEPPSGEEKKRLLMPFGLRKLTKKEKDMGQAKKQTGHKMESLTVRDTSTEKGSFLFDSQPQKGGSAPSFKGDTDWSSPQTTKGASFLNRIRDSQLSPLKFFFKVKKQPKRAATNVGKRAEAVTTTHRGRAMGWKVPEGKTSDIHFPATIRAAARMQRFRAKSPNTAITIFPKDIREKLRVYRAPMTIMFVLDLSESMLENLDDVKEAMLRLHNDAYRYRDKVGLVAFKQLGAVVVQHPTANLRLVANKLLKLKMSGFTSLAAGMLKALEVLKEAKRRDLSTIPVMVIISDGEANVPLRRNLQTGEIRGFDLLNVAFFKYEREAVEDVFSVSELMKKDGMYTVVVNTGPPSTGPRSTSGLGTTEMIASITNGIHHEVSMDVFAGRGKSAHEISNTILQAQRQVSHFHYLSRRIGIK